jgi:hypothetical protein
MSANKSTTRVEYRDIVGWPGYRVGDDGSVWSRRNRGGRGGKSYDRMGTVWRQLQAFPDKDGYLHVGLRCDGKHKKFLVSHLVLSAFKGPRPDGLEACHENGKPADDRADNLRWDTHQANSSDKAAHGTQQRGSLMYNAKINEDIAREIKILLAAGVPKLRIARKLGISRWAVDNISRGRAWKHVSV